MILQQFNSDLLSLPSPKLRDWSDSFEYMWKEVLKLWKKLEENPQKKLRCELLKAEILELYERVKVKEKEREGQTDHKTQGFGYFVAIPKGLAEDVHVRLKFGRKAGSFKHEFRKNNAFSTKRKKA
jgi:hypothetical protein